MQWRPQKMTSFSCIASWLQVVDKKEKKKEKSLHLTEEEKKTPLSEMEKMGIGHT